MAHQTRRPRSLSGSSRRRVLVTALLGVVVATTLVDGALDDNEGGLIRGQIFSQSRQPMPEHKIRSLREARMLDFDSDVPLHAGYGTHYAFLYVGTPPQRVSVIIDTGSHWTAFPCTGCKQCGDDHTDPVFDNQKSSSFHALSCNECKFSSHCSQGQCSVSLSYAEGSRWDAYEAKDQVYLGGDAVDTPNVKGGSALSMPFVFGCQSYETGLFRSQLENGIMGLSNQDLTLVPKLRENGKIAKSIFSLCFNTDGGSLTVGGYDESHHTVPITFLPLLKDQGWYTIRLKDIKIGGKSIGVNENDYNSGQGTIVDSGTTDTYLPRSMQGAFTRAFKAAAGRDYSNRVMSLTEKEFQALPDIVFVFDNGHEESMPWDSYIECGDDNSCAGGIFFDNPSGVVLGANFMKGRDVVFDLDGRRVGFAKANCEYAGVGAAATPTAGSDTHPNAAATTTTATTTTITTDMDCALTFNEATGPCDAVCPEGGGAGVAYGHEPWSMVVGTPAQGNGKPCVTPAPASLRPCLVNCTGTATTPTEAATAAAGGDGTSQQQQAAATTPVAPPPPAPTKKCSTGVIWSPCPETCVQQGEGEAEVEGKCAPFKLDRPCSTGALCALANKGFLVDFAVILHGLEAGVSGGGNNNNRGLSTTDKETILEEVSHLLQVPGGDVELLSTTTTSAGVGEVPIRLHLTQNSTSVLAVTEPKSLLPAQKAAEVSSTLRSESFSLALLSKLKKAGGVFENLESLELVDTGTHNLDSQVGGVQHAGSAPSSANQQKISLFFWDIVGGTAAAFLLLMLIIHFRWSHWTSVGSNNSQQQSGSLFNRVRNSVVIEPGSAKRSGSTPKPSSRAYERVSNEEAGGAGGAEEIEMI